MEQLEPAKSIIKIIATMNYIYIRTLMTDKLKWHRLHTLTWTMTYVARLTPATTSIALPSTPAWGRICTTALSVLWPTTTGMAAPPPWPPGWPATTNYIYIRNLMTDKLKWHQLHTLTWTMIYVARLTPATTSTAPPSAPTWGRICTAALLALRPTTTS